MVYCIHCSQRGLLYVDETKQRLGDCFVEHLRSVRNRVDNTFQSPTILTPPPTPLDDMSTWASSSVTMMPPANRRNSTSYSTWGAYSPMVS
eukprot:g28247.t1